MAERSTVHEKPTFCRICEPQCPMLAEVGPDGKVRGLKPDRSHPSGGKACHKGLSYLDIHRDPDRLDYPLKRLAPGSGLDEFERIGWDEAIADIANRLEQVRRTYGNQSVAVYHGNPFSMCNSTGAALVDSVLAALETPMVFNSQTQDASNKVVGAIAVYGSMGSLMVPDLAHTHYLLCLGANPRVSRWTFASVPNDDMAIVRGIVERGGKVRFVNPRKIESSTSDTGPTLLVKPGSDVYFLAALLHEIDSQGGFDEDLLSRYGKGVANMRAFAAAYPIERVAAIVGIEPAEIREIASEIIAAPSAAVYMSTGLNQSGNGVLAYWLVEMINFATGNLGRRGGTHKPSGLFPGGPPAEGVETVQTSLGSFELMRPIGPTALPLTMLPALIEAGDIRALIVLGGNPVITGGGEAAFRAARDKLDLMVSFDIYPQATVALSDYVLPATDWIEHADINHNVSGMQVKPYIQYAEALEPPTAERRNGWWFLSRLLQELGHPSALDADPAATDGEAVIEGLLSLRGLSIGALKAMPSNSCEFADLPPESLFERCLAHPDGKIDCYPERFVEKGLFKRLEAQFEDMAGEPEEGLKLISLRTRYMHNSWLANQRRFRRGANAVNPLHVSEQDAIDRGLHDGDHVRVYNQFGEITAFVQVDPDLRPGVVAMTHGYGNGLSPGLSEASEKPGANCNALMPIGPGTFEPLSYMSLLSAVPVEIDRADPD